MITTREYFIYDNTTGEIFEKIQAYSKKLSYKPDGSEWWVLEHIDGEFNNNRWYDPHTAICVGDCYINPAEPMSFKLKDGTEEQFKFFQKHGYVKESTTG